MAYTMEGCVSEDGYLYIKRGKGMVGVSCINKAKPTISCSHYCVGFGDIKNFDDNTSALDLCKKVGQLVFKKLDHNPYQCPRCKHQLAYVEAPCVNPECEVSI